MTRGRPPRAAAPSSATHVVLLLALAAATSLPAAHAAVTVAQLKDSTTDIHLNELIASTFPDQHMITSGEYLTLFGKLLLLYPQ